MKRATLAMTAVALVLPMAPADAQWRICTEMGKTCELSR